MTTSNKYILGADIGGSHITAAVVDVAGRVLLQDTYIREHLDTNGSVGQIIDIWTAVIQKSIALSGKQITKIGLALPGPFDYEQGISYIKDQGKYDNLYDINVKDKLAEALDISPKDIFFDNDAACFLRGEIFSGNAEDGVNLLGLTLGTGLGSVVSVNGKVSDAELWSSSLRDGIAEDYLSTRWFVKKYYDLTGRSVKDVRQICEIATDENLKTIFFDFGNNLKDFLQVQINKFAPQQIIIGGNITKASAHFMPIIQTLTVPIKIASLGEDSALMGAAGKLLKS